VLAAGRGKSQVLISLEASSVEPEFRLAPAGTSNWGPDQCKNDKDGSVEPDERLRIIGITSGHFDAKFSDVGGRKCTVRDIKIDAGAVFAIEEKDLTSCDR